MIILIIGCICFIKSDDNIFIPEDSIRFRIIANSNSEIDINFKKEFKSYIESIIYPLIKDAKSSDEVNNIIVNNLDYINNNIYKYLGNNDYSFDYGLNYFPKKSYKGVIYKEGYYRSLVITLGDGNGNNWWCSLFPPLCLIEDNDTTLDVEYKLYIKEILNILN